MMHPSEGGCVKFTKRAERSTVSSEERRRREAYLRRKRRRKRRRTIQIIKRAAIICVGVFLIVFGITRVLKKDVSPDEVKAQKEAPSVAKKAAKKERASSRKSSCRTRTIR